jgi:predicted TIM-barrel fold metal-dependent hydrolase
MAKDFKKDDFFKIDPECHLVGDMKSLQHYPGVQMWWKAAEGITRSFNTGMPPNIMEELEPHEREKNSDPESYIAVMDKYGVDIACLLPESMMDTLHYSSRWFTNEEMARVVESHPDRFMYQPNLSPIKLKGVKNTLWELEYWVKEKGAKIFKYYSPEDTYMNDPELWPVYEKAQELGIVLDLHTGFSWVPPGKSKYALPLQLDDIARDFPELKIVAFHMGYPYCNDLNMVAMSHPNVYPSLSLLMPWAISAPRKFAKILGEAIRCVGTERIIWGIDYVGFAWQYKFGVEGLQNFQFPKDMQEGYGYPEFTDDDRRKIFGENLGKLLGIDTSKRRVKV